MSQDPIAHLTRVDKTLARLIRKVEPLQLVRKRRSPFEALVHAVAHQQLNGTAASTILGRVKALYPGRKFPTPEDLLDTRDENLRSAGLSRNKVLAIKDIARKTVEGVVPSKAKIAAMTDGEIMERLLEVRGVGPWTVEMLLIFTLGRGDILPATDYGVRKGFALTYRLRELPSPKELLAQGERWRPHRTIAAWYLWRALELPQTTQVKKS